MFCEFTRITPNPYRCGSRAIQRQVLASRQAVPGRGSLLWRSTLRCDFAAMLGLGSASRNSLRALRPLRSNRRDESVHNAPKRARPQAEHRSHHRNEPLPGTACREPTGWARLQRTPTMHEEVGVPATNTNQVSTKSCPGRPRRIVARRLGLLDFVAARLRASLTDSSYLFERSGLRARSELYDAATKSSKPRGVGAKHRPPCRCAAACPDTTLPRAFALPTLSCNS